MCLLTLYIILMRYVNLKEVGLQETLILHEADVPRAANSVNQLWAHLIPHETNGDNGKLSLRVEVNKEQNHKYSELY
jgi:hypothetical protein